MHLAGQGVPPAGPPGAWGIEYKVEKNSREKGGGAWPNSSLED